MLKHATYEGPPFAPGDRVAVADDRATSLTKACGKVGVVLRTVGPFVVVHFPELERVPVSPWLPPVPEHGVRCVLPEFLYDVPWCDVRSE